MELFFARLRVLKYHNLNQRHVSRGLALGSYLALVYIKFRTTLLMKQYHKNQKETPKPIHPFLKICIDCGNDDITESKLGIFCDKCGTFFYFDRPMERLVPENGSKNKNY